MKLFHFPLVCMRKIVKLKTFAAGIVKSFDAEIVKKLGNFQHFAKKFVIKNLHVQG